MFVRIVRRYACRRFISLAGRGAESTRMCMSIFWPKADVLTPSQVGLLLTQSGSRIYISTFITCAIVHRPAAVPACF
jgi:hypothetical protein